MFSVQQTKRVTQVAGKGRRWHIGNDSQEMSQCIKKKPQHSCFPVNIAKFLRTPILKNIFERMILTVSSSTSNHLLVFIMNL